MGFDVCVEFVAERIVWVYIIDSKKKEQVSLAEGSDMTYGFICTVHGVLTPGGKYQTVKSTHDAVREPLIGGHRGNAEVAKLFHLLRGGRHVGRKAVSCLLVKDVSMMWIVPGFDGGK